MNQIIVPSHLRANLVVVNRVRAECCPGFVRPPHPFMLFKRRDQFGGGRCDVEVYVGFVAFLTLTLALNMAPTSTRTRTLILTLALTLNPSRNPHPNPHPSCNPHPHPSPP